MAFLAAAACASHAPEPAQPERPIDELVEADPDISSRDLFHGVGGRALVPRTDLAYRFIEKDTSGFSDNFEIEDPQGRRWDAKFGEEVKAEVAASRLLWAVGFHQPPIYYVPAWRIEGGPEAGAQPEARFRFEDPKWEKDGDWSWKDNPFVGTRELNGLIAMNVLINNWDLKTSNNKMYRVAGGLPKRLYVVKDIGRSFGGSVRVFLGSQSSPEEFAEERFIRAVHDDVVEFDFEPVMLGWGIDQGVRVDDVLWACRRVARLSDRQLGDAFRSAGYSDSEVEAFVALMKRRVQEGLALEQRARS
jgi:hypothetical protein